MDTKKNRYPGRSVSETGKYNLHVVFTAAEYELLEKLCVRGGDVPKADLIRRLVLGGAMAAGIPLPQSMLAALLAEELAPPKPPKNGKKHPPSPGPVDVTEGSFGACSSSSS
jgi:hypothetical protein